MTVKVVKEFLGIPVGTIGVVTDQEGNILKLIDSSKRSMWIKFDCKDMPVGIPEDFGLFIVVEDKSNE